MGITREKNNKGLDVLHKKEDKVYLESYQFQIEQNLYLFCYLSFPRDDDDISSRKWIACFLNEKRLIEGQAHPEGKLSSEKFFMLISNPRDLGEEEIALYLLREHGT